MTATPFEPTWESLKAGYRIPRWYEDAKFGIFIHWGVYAVPAFGNEWYPRNMYQPGTPEFEHHIATYGPHTEFGYKDFIPQLTAEHFDPAAWAKLFKEAGARYIVPVAEHHDGFAMYDSKFTEWSAAKIGPRRDLIGELAEAVRAEDMIFGVSYHRAENWFFFDGGRSFPSDVQDERNRGLYGYALPKPADQGDPHATSGWSAPARSWIAIIHRCFGSIGGFSTTHSSHTCRALPPTTTMPRAHGGRIGSKAARRSIISLQPTRKAHRCSISSAGNWPASGNPSGKPIRRSRKIPGAMSTTRITKPSNRSLAI
jgi:hypothetical protein